MAFESLTERLQGVFKNLRRKGKLSEKEVQEVTKEIRLALLEADVALPVVKTFIKRVRERAVGHEIIDTLDASQQIIKIVNEELTEILGSETSEIEKSPKIPTIIMMVGLQGAGKTTFAGKLANKLIKEQEARPMMIAADIYRPAAIDQLKTLGQQINVPVFDMGTETPAVEIVKNGLEQARANKNDYPMMVQRYVALAFEKGQVPTMQNLPLIYPYLQTQAVEIEQTKAKFADMLAVSENCSVIGFCPGAEFGPAKRWPHYHYAKLAEMLIEKGYAIRLFGSKKDQEVGEQIRESLPENLRSYCVNLAGLTDLNQAVDLIADCVAVVSNDSGLMHIAAALNKPLVALYGPTSPQYTPPLSPNAEVIRLIEGGLIKIRKGEGQGGYHQSLIDITPERVMDTLLSKLNKA